MLANVIALLHCGFLTFSGLADNYFLTPAVFVYVSSVESAMMV